MKRAFLPILAIALVAPFAVAGDWEVHACGWTPTPADDLSVSRTHYRDGTNLTARGRFREAEGVIGGGIGTATRRLHELEQRTAGLETLRGFADQFGAIWERYKVDWTNAAVEALTLEEPIKVFVATNAIIREPLEWRLKSFEWLRKELEENDKMNAGANLRNTRDALRGQVEAYEQLQPLEADFRAVLADLERAREELKAERAKPLDARRALGIAREYVERANRKIAAPGSQFVGADWDFTCAKNYLDDVRATGELKDEVAEIESSIDAAKRKWNLTGFRYYMREAQSYLEQDRPDVAKMQVGSAESIYLSRLKGDPAFEELSELAGELREAAERMIEEREDAELQADIRRAREELGDPAAPILPDVLLAPDGRSEEAIRRFADETDFAAVLKQEFSEDRLELAVYRHEGARIIFPDDPEFIPTIRAAMIQAVNTNYPAEFPSGDRVSLVLSPPPTPGPYSRVFSRTRTGANGQTIKEVVPHQRLLHMIQSSKQPEDLFLYFPDAAEDLFVPGGRTALIPGLGAYLEKKLPKSWADPKPITFKGEAFKPPRPKPTKPPPPRCVCKTPEPDPACRCGCKERMRCRNGAQAKPKTLREQLEALDIVANITNRLDEPFIRLSFTCEEKRFDVPTNDWNGVLATLRGAVETKFPDDLSGGESFRLLLVLSETEQWIVKTDGDKNKNVNMKPGVSFVDFVRFPANRDDAYLDFTGPLSELVTPGGKTAIVPGIGALLDRFLPPGSATSAD